MPIFEYITFVCEADQLQAELDKLGAERWRLHTCEPVASYGPSGTGVLNTFVVMDRIVPEPQEDYEASNQRIAEGIPMRG